MRGVLPIDPEPALLSASFLLVYSTCILYLTHSSIETGFVYYREFIKFTDEHGSSPTSLTSFAKITRFAKNHLARTRVFPARWSRSCSSLATCSVTLDGGSPCLGDRCYSYIRRGREPDHGDSNLSPRMNMLYRHVLPCKLRIANPMISPALTCHDCDDDGWMNE